MDTWPVTVEEFRAYLEEHGLNGWDAARLLHVSRRSVGFWMAGKVDLPYSVWFMLRTKVEGTAPELR